MKRVGVFVVAVILMAALVWYAVSCLPRAGPAPEATAPAVLHPPPLGPACGSHCGTERWTVKTLSDPDRDCVNLAPVSATVEELVALPEPAHRPAAARIHPVECTVYRVTAHLAGWDTIMPRLESDHDLHMVLFGQTNQRVSLIAEIPDPQCQGSCQAGLSRQFAQIREALLREVADPTSPIGRAPNRALVVVTGVGFFDFKHNQNGLAPNAFELHPVLSIEFPPLDTTP